MFIEKLKMEFLGTFLHIYITGMSLIQAKTQAVDKLALAISNFIIYALLQWSSKAISGGQFNPVITSSLIISRHVRPMKGLIIVFFQLVASIFAVSLLKVTNPATVLTEIKETTIIGFPIVGTGMLKVMLLEALGTFFFVLAYYALVLEKNAPKNMYGAGIGAVVFVDTLFLFNKTGCSLNPLKSLAYAMVGNNYRFTLAYVLGPIIGGLMGCFLGNAGLSEKAESTLEKSKVDKQKRRSTAIKKRMSMVSGQ